MTKNLVWRLSQKPTVEDLKNAVEAQIISKEEAKQMLVREEDEKKIDQDELKDLKDEIKLLRELVLANLGTSQVKIIEKHYHDDWYPRWSSWTSGMIGDRMPVSMYCSAAGIGETLSGGMTDDGATILKIT